MNRMQKFFLKMAGLGSTSIIMQGQKVNVFSMGADMGSFAEKGYGGNPYVYSVVRQIATKCAAIPWTLYQVKQEKAFAGYRIKSRLGIHKLHRDARELKADALEEVTDTQVNEILARPNLLQTWAEFVEALISFKLVMGNAFALGYAPVDGPNKGNFKEVFAYRSDRITIVAPPFPAAVTGYEVNFGAARSEPFAPERVMHIKTLHLLNPRIGMSPIEPALMPVKTNNQKAEWDYAITQNLGGMPGLLILDQDTLTPEEVDDFYARYRSRQSGAPNAGLPMLAAGKAQWHDTVMRPKDMEFAETVQLTANQIALAFNWPPELVGDSNTKTYSNTKEMMKYAYVGNILPEMDALRDSFNEYLLRGLNAAGRKFFLDYELEDIEALQEDRAATWNRVFKGWESGVLSLNETRREINYDAVPGPEGDQRQVPVGLLGSGGTPVDITQAQASFEASLKFVQDLEAQAA